MLSRRRFALALGAAAAAAPDLVLGQEPDAGPDAPYSIAAGEDRFDRMTVAVMIGASGPYRFVVDTGADRSVLAEEIAAELGLPMGRQVLVHGLTGSDLASTVQAPPLTLGRVVIKGLDLPVLPRARLGVDGLLGVDALQRRRLVMDFRARRLEIQPTGSAFYMTRDGRETYVPAHDRYGRLVVVDAQAGSTSISAFVDSGSGVSIANHALADALQARGAWRDAPMLVPLLGVTSQEATGQVRVLETLRLGGLRFTDLTVIVADLHVFDEWGLNSKPTILVGTDVLRLFSRVELDYGRRRIMFRVGADPMIWLA
ncbi:MAG: retroviral-like aspartic protease family protein [Pseudomonadota bacterium]